MAVCVRRGTEAEEAVREFSRVLPSFWTGETSRKIRALGEAGITARLVAAYLITCPHAEALGVYRLPLPYIAHDIGCSIEGASEALRCLSEVGFAQYDPHSEVVWVPEMARIQVGDLKEGDKRRTWVASEARKIEKLPFFADFVAKYARAYGLPYEAPSKGLPRASEAKSKRESKREKKLPSSSDEPTTPSEGDQIRAVFGHWLAVMRRNPKTTKLDAKREGKIRARLREGRTVEDLCRAIDGCRASSWHMGDNPDGKRHDDVELICRDAAHVERFAGETAPAVGGTQTDMAALLDQVAASRAANAKRHEVPAA